MIRAPDLGVLISPLRYSQSIISVPTLTKIAPNTARGISLAYCAPPKTIASKITACKAPEIGVKPPAFTLVMVLMVAPAPGKPPNSPDNVLPTPWPINSRSDL